MDKIQIHVLEPEMVAMSEKLMVACARLTQHGHEVTSIEDFMSLYNKPYNPTTVSRLAALPHPTLQKFGTISLVVVGASRRFLAQITRHQNEVKFMSASLQYSDMTGHSRFVVPYEVMADDAERCQDYIRANNNAIRAYEKLIADGADHDTAGYLMPHSMRNVLVISATAYQWKHMIRQRTCRRNTSETRYVMLRCWEELYKLSPALFADAGPFCMRGYCEEGTMSCGNVIDDTMTPSEILQQDFPLLYEHYDVTSWPGENTTK